MEQERGGGGGGGRLEEMEGFEQQDQSGAGGRFVMKQNQNYQQAPALPPPSQNQPQKCPRCESLNTKFCYYNNYSLSQPRYFCKTCRRYWTQGGTLRNVPVGGGCRKGKRLKKPSSSSSSACALDTISANKQNQATPSAATPSNLIDKAINTNISSAHPITPFNFPGAGFFSSLAAIQSFNGEFGGSNLALLQGFTHPSFYHHQQQQLQQQQQQQNLQFHQTPQTQTHVFNNLVNSEEALEENGILPNRTSTPTTHQEWPPQSFNATDPITSSQAGYWSNNNNNTSSGGGGSLNLNPTHHWVDLPGFGAPPSSTSPSSPPSFL